MDDATWSLVKSQVDTILSGFDRNIVDVVVLETGFVVIWKKIRTKDFAATKAELVNLYGRSPWELRGPYLTPDSN